MAAAQRTQHSNNLLKLWAAIAVFFVLTQVLIFGVQRERWFDVSFSFETAHKINNGEKIDWAHYDVHPPTYYYLLAGWDRLNPGISEYIWAQELSVLIGIGFVVFVFLLLSYWFGSAGENAALALSALTPYLHFGTEARGYILLLMLCAMAMWARSTDKWKAAPYFVVFIAPLIHYFGVCIIAMLVIYDFVMDYKRIDLVLIFCGLLGTSLAFFMFALPQQQQAAGTWYFESTITSFPSAAMYTMLLIDDVGNQGRAVTLWLYVLLMIGMVYALYLLYKERTQQDLPGSMRFPIVMLISILAPLALLTIQTVIPGAWRLYHHRIFLSITWMFAAMILVMLFRSVEYRGKAALAILSACVVIFSIGSFYEYSVSAHHELGNMMEATPCTGNLTYVLHESPFSMLPYESYNRDHKCGWIDQVETDLDVAESHTAGFDAIAPEKIFWNETFPINRSFYFVLNEGHIWKAENLTYTKIASNPGIVVLKVN